MKNVKPSIVSALSRLVSSKNIFSDGCDDATIYPRLIYQELLNIGSEFADDDEVMSEIHFQIDIWTKNQSTSQLAKEVNRVMKSVGFFRTDCRDEPEESVNGEPIKHKIMRFSATVDVETENYEEE